MNDQPTWQSLQRQYPTFTFLSFSYQIISDNFVITFSFQLSDTIFFAPTVTIKNVDIARLGKVSKDVIDNLVFHLGIIELFSYWKLTASPTIAIKCGSLDTAQVMYWQDLLALGMGEYSYHNTIPVDVIRSITFDTSGLMRPLFTDSLRNASIVPVGGGKDSVVALELTKQGKEVAAFTLNQTESSRQVIELSGIAKTIQVERILDSKLFELNQNGFLNGHTPFSAYVAFLTVLCAVLFDYQDIILANERSANQGNVEYQGLIINHQYSKTFDFEKKFHQYARHYLASNINYFSLLRPVYEIQIAKVFSHFQKYFSVFRSCNVGQKTNSWCGNCSKCLFVFIMLCPFIAYKDLIAIFKQDLLAKSSLLPVFKQLLGLESVKPFECVGTYEEVRAALYLSLQNKQPNQALLTFFEKAVLLNYPNIENDTNLLLRSWNDENLVSEEYTEKLKQLDL